MKKRRLTFKGDLLPKVVYYEMGNEGYFGEEILSVPTMATWIKVIVKNIKAMKAVDPNIKIGIPIHTMNSPNGNAWMEYTYRVGGDWIPTVLANITKQVSIDFVTTHNSYLPYYQNTQNGNSRLFYC